MGNTVGVDWQSRSNAHNFAARKIERRLLELSFPGGQPSEPGQFAELAVEIRSTDHPRKLAFQLSDDFTGPTAGYHFVQVLVDDQVIWEQDVAGAETSRLVEIDILWDAIPGSEDIWRLAFRLYDKKRVTNFGVRVHISSVKLIYADCEKLLIPSDHQLSPDYQQYPPDLPLPALPVRGSEWTRKANIVQPWGTTQDIAIRQAGEWAPKLAREFGFNALIMLPPNAHNAIVDDYHKSKGLAPISDEQFVEATAAYRCEGLKLILYTAVMHSGHDPEWQFGNLSKKHPEWAMRDPDGRTITQYGYPWLCPSTGALEYTLQYTEGIVRRYQADAVMLDNNEFLYSDAGGPTCYCKDCRKGFREYVVKRFGEKGLRDLMDLSPDEVASPRNEGEPLWGLWLSWRKRVWAEVMEKYRERLREINPDIVVLANTQYTYGSWILGVDGQYEHEDAILAESRGLTGPGMAAKMIFGRAIAGQDRPLWNYIGTFRENNFDLLHEPEQVEVVCASSIASGANPWIVFYGFTGKENEASQRVMSTYLKFWHDHAELIAGGKDVGRIGMILSPESRDMSGRSILPSWLNDLLAGGLSVQGIWEPYEYKPEDISHLSVIVAASTVCMRKTTVQALAHYVRGGGKLIVTAQTSGYDEYGRWRNENALASELGEDIANPGEYRIGQGSVICIENETDTPDAVKKLVQPEAQKNGEMGVFRRMTGDGRSVLALVGFDGPIGQVQVRVPEAVKTAKLYMPDQEPRTLNLESRDEDGRAAFSIGAGLGVLVW